MFSMNGKFVLAVFFSAFLLSVIFFPMIDRSIDVSSSSTTAETNAFIAYRDSITSLSIPKERTWTGDTATWGSQSGMPTAGSPVRFVRVAYSPIEQRSFEKIVVTLSDDGYVDAYVWGGTSWTVTNNIGSTGIIVNTLRCFDIAYERTSGRALLVYSTGTTNKIGYRIWTFGSGWGSEQLLDLAYTTTAVSWIALAQAPGTRSGTGDDNEIAMIYIDAASDVHGYVWTGSEWSLMGATAVWDATAAMSTEECIAVAYEQASGRAMFVWGDATATDNYYRIWDGSTLSGPTLGPDIAAQGATTNWITLKSNPLSTSNELMFLVVDGASDLNTAYWSGSAWTIHTEHDDSVDTHAQRCADFAWEPTGSKGLLVWGTTAGQIAYKTYTAPNTWGTITNPTMGANIHPWVQLRTNTRSISGDMMILGAVLEGTVFDLGGIRWNGTTFTVIGTTTFSADTTVITYECFEMEFMNFNPPTPARARIDLYTQKAPYDGRGPGNASDAFAPGEEVILTAFVTYNEDPVAGIIVTFEIYDPLNNLFLARTNVTNINGSAIISFRFSVVGVTFGKYNAIGRVTVAGETATDTLPFEVGWIIEIKVTTMALVQLGPPKVYEPSTSFAKGEQIHFLIKAKNIAFTNKPVIITSLVQDSFNVPIGGFIFDFTIPGAPHEPGVAPKWYPIFRIGFEIPVWAFPGPSMVYANALAPLPGFVGQTYCPEIRIPIEITLA